MSFADRFRNTQSYIWQPAGDSSRLMTVVDSYGRPTNFTYAGSGAGSPLQQITDFWNRQINFQQDGLGHLVAAVGPSITRGANNNANIFPNGTAYVFQYDINNPRPERRNDLLRIWYPNQAAPFLDSSRTVNVAAVYASATPRRQFSYYNDPTDAFQYGKVQQHLESATGSGSVGSGASGYMYLNSGLPANILDPSDPIIARTIKTDRMGNQSLFDSNANWMVVHSQVFATRGKNSLQAASWEHWKSYNTHNQVLIHVEPEGNSTVNAYEDETNTITINGVPYAPRIGLLKSTTRLPGNTIGLPSRAGSNGQTQLTELFFYDPIFNQLCASIEPRGNPIDGSGTFFTPQNGGTTPTSADRSRYATTNYLDYQKDSAATVEADAALQAQLALTSSQIGDLIAWVDNQMNAGGTAGPLPLGFQTGIGDVNGEGTGAGTGINARHQGAIVQVIRPSVRQLVPNTGAGDPWISQTQNIVELFTSNARGQGTTYTDPEGNLKLFIRYPENDPEGASQYLVPSLSNQQYGFLKELHVDADPATVMSLIGTDGDMITFIGNKITRTNTPGVYQDLVTKFQPSATGSGCTSCAYDPLGNPLSTTDPNNNTTVYDRNELGEVWRTTGPAPYYYQVENSFDSNRNTVRIDTLDLGVQFASDNPADPLFGQFTPTGSGTQASFPVQPGPGGAVRPGWFTNVFDFDLLDNPIEQDIDATGSSPASLVTTSQYDFNQNKVKIIKPLGNTIELDYDERNIHFATRVGGPTGSVTIKAFDGNGNLIDIVGPAQRGTSSQSLTAVIDDAFNSGTALTHTGDWVLQNTLDGFDRAILGTDAAGGTVANTFDPAGNVIASERQGTPGGATPTDRTGSGNVPLASGATNFDEANRPYERLQNVFLNTLAGHALPSGRAVTHAGGGLATNSTTNNHTGVVTLTSGGTSYVLDRTVFDRSGRTAAMATDNGAITNNTFDGANRRFNAKDPLSNQQQNVFDGNSNVVGSTRIDACTKAGVTTTESFGSAAFVDPMNRQIVTAMQGPNGTFHPQLAFAVCASWSTFAVSCPRWLTPNGTIFTFAGFDSRGNPTVMIDPKANTALAQYDGANRKLRTLQHLRVGGSGTNPIFKTVTTTGAYDANSNFIRLVDDNGGVTGWSFDMQDRNTVMTFHDGSTRTNTFNLASDIVGYVDENGSVFANTVDVLGRKTIVGITLATGVVGTTAQAFQFDGLSQMTFGRDTVGSTNCDIGFIRDSVGRKVEESQTYAGDTRYVTHDQWTSLTAIGITYPNGRQVSTAYDLLNRKNAINETSGGASIAAWDFFGNRTALLALGNGLTCSFMNNAQTNSAVQTGVPIPPWGSISTDRLGFDGTGRPIAKRYLPTGSTTALVANTTAFDSASNKLFERALHAESRSSLYPGYDSMNRLLEYQRGNLASGGGSITTPISLPGTNQEQDYNLDGLANWKNTTITPQGGSPTVQNRVHNKLNELTQLASTPVLYDYGNNAGTAFPNRGNGNIVDDGARLNAFDALNRLNIVKRKSDGATIGQYVYDATGRRALKIVSNGGLSGTITNGTYRYISDGQQIVEELNGSNSTTRQFIWGRYIDELMQMKTYVATGAQSLPAGAYYLLSDLLYRSQALTNSSGAIVEPYDCDAYGNTVIFSGPGTDGLWFTNDDVPTLQPACDTIFSGRQYDPETELYFYRSRYYEPPLGRHLNRNPWGYIQARYNLYDFCDSNPVRFVEPFSAVAEPAAEAPGGFVLRMGPEAPPDSEGTGASGTAPPPVYGAQTPPTYRVDPLFNIPIQMSPGTQPPSSAYPPAPPGYEYDPTPNISAPGTFIVPDIVPIPGGKYDVDAGNSGDCTPAELAALSANIKLQCKTGKRSCTDQSLTCDQLWDYYKQNGRCADARNHREQKCFAGGDSRHQRVILAAFEAQALCFNRLLDKKCPQVGCFIR